MGTGWGQFAQAVPKLSVQVVLLFGNENQSRSLGRGCDEAHFSEKNGFFSEKGGGNSVNEGLVRISTGKAIQ